MQHEKLRKEAVEELATPLLLFLFGAPLTGVGTLVFFWLLSFPYYFAQSLSQGTQHYFTFSDTALFLIPLSWVILYAYLMWQAVVLTKNKKFRDNPTLLYGGIVVALISVALFALAIAFLYSGYLFSR